MESIIIAAITGVISAAGTVAAIRTDISWLKEAIKDHSRRLISIERQIK